MTLQRDDIVQLCDDEVRLPLPVPEILKQLPLRFSESSFDAMLHIFVALCQSERVAAPPQTPLHPVQGGFYQLIVVLKCMPSFPTIGQ